MFLHTHPYPPFLFPEAEKLIVGTLPPPRFTTGQLKEGDVHFCYGSRDGLLWPILDRLFKLQLEYADTARAVEQRQHFLRSRKIGVCDIVASAQREKIDATDLGMQSVTFRNILGVLEEYPTVHTLLFTGGNSKNGPEYFMRKVLKAASILVESVDDAVPRQNRFQLPSSGRWIKTVSLTAPSGSANRAVGSMAEYKKRKAADPKYTTLDFRVDQYRPFF
jgi:G:T/U-mismatch repair DNA glycosylase